MAIRILEKIVDDHDKLTFNDFISIPDFSGKKVLFLDNHVSHPRSNHVFVWHACSLTAVEALTGLLWSDALLAKPVKTKEEGLSIYSSGIVPPRDTVFDRTYQRQPRWYPCYFIKGPKYQEVYRALSPVAEIPGHPVTVH